MSKSDGFLVRMDSLPRFAAAVVRFSLAAEANIASQILLIS